MLSDHSEDEEEIRRRRHCAGGSGTSKKQPCQAPCYMTIPDPNNFESHTSYKRLRHDIITRSGLAFDIPPKSSSLIDSTCAEIQQPPEAVTEEMLFQPSCSSIRSIIKNARYGLPPPRQQNHTVVPSNRGFINAIDKSQLVAYRNRITPNRRKIIDRNQTKTFCAHYIRDGDGLLTASQDHNIRIYERKTARQRYVKTCTIEVPFVGWSILDVAVSPNGRHVIYSTWNNVLYQFDLENEGAGWQDLPFDMDDSRFGIFSIKFNSTGSEVMAGTTSGLYIYNREIDRCVMKVDGHDDDINAVCFANEDSNLVLSSGDDGLVKLWDRRTMGYQGDGKPVAIFAGHRDGITFIDSRGDDRYFLTNSKDQSIKVWDLRIHSDKAGIDATKRSVKGQKWDYRWQYLPSSSIKTTNLPGDSSVMTIRGHSVLHTLIRSRFSPNHTGKRFIYTGCARGSCVVYDLYTGELHKKYNGHKAVVRDCQWHPYDNEIITSGWDGNVLLWRYDARGPKQKFLDNDSQIVQPYDSTDEWDQPIPKTMKERENREKQRNAQVFNPAQTWRGPPNTVNNRAARIKYAQTDPDPPTSSSDEEEQSYAAVAKRARRRLRRSGGAES
uniref:Uncharacterized protein n=1 Tax=Panagrolaimus superbus TaxID=310955 RepID=A0A914Y490_9BILA